MELFDVLRVGVFGAVSVLVAALAVRLILFSIRFEGLLAAPGATGVSVERVQLLVVTVLTGLRYAAAVVSARGTAMPELSRLWLAVFGTSCVIYLMAKAVRMWAIRRFE